MNRISQKFEAVRKQRRCSFMPFLVAGHPNFQKSLAALTKLSAGADLLEIGFPYSDPLADGPVIQQADTESLDNGMTTAKVFELIKKLRLKTTVPITVLVYANLVYQQGIESFYKQAKKSGIDGVLIPDVPVEESAEFVLAAKKYGIAPIFLVTQTTTLSRLKKISQFAEGFIYIVSVLGVTGARNSFHKDTFKLVSFVKKHSKLPTAIGFGVSTPDHIRKFKRAGVDGVIVASALVKLLEKSPEKMLTLAKELKHAC